MTGKQNLQVTLCESWAIIWTSTYYQSKIFSLNYSTFTIFKTTLRDDMAVKSCKKCFQHGESIARNENARYLFVFDSERSILAFL